MRRKLNSRWRFCWLNDDAAGQFPLPGHLDSLLHHHWMLQPAGDVSSRSVLLAYLRSAGEAEYRHVRKFTYDCFASSGWRHSAATNFRVGRFASVVAMPIAPAQLIEING